MKAHVESFGRLRISACTIAKNEAANIARSINSYRDFADEIIVVDTGSTDDTVKIAESLGARVLHFKWCDDFSAAKNMALDAATADWIIFLDADEYFCAGSGSQVPAAIKKADAKGCNVIFCPLVNIDQDDHDRYLSDFAQARIFKAGVRYILPVHETLSVPGGISPFYVKRSDLYLLHTGYSASIREDKTKRNLVLLEKELLRSDDPHIRFLCQAYLASTYAGLGQFDDALKSAQAYFNRPAGHIYNSAMDLKAYIALCNALANTGSGVQEVLQWVEKAPPVCRTHPDTVYMQGCLLLVHRLFLQALALHEKAYQYFKNYKAVDECTFAAKTTEYYHTLGLCREGLLDYPNAIDCYVKALNSDGDAIDAIKRLCTIIKQTPDNEIDQFIGTLFRNADVTKKGTILGGLMANYMSKSLIRCYTYYHQEKKFEKLDPNVAAFIAAGEANFQGASALFIKAYQISSQPDTATRALLCAVMSDDGSVIEEALKIADPKQAAALGITAASGFDEDDMPRLAAMVAEAGRMRGGDYAAGLARDIAGRVGAPMRHEFVLQLEKIYEFSGALAVAELMKFDAESAFLRGYYSYRLGLPDEATVWLEAAGQLGYDKPDLNATLENLREVMGRDENKEAQSLQSEAVKEESVASINMGDWAQAVTQVRRYRRLRPQDPDGYSIEAVACYQAGDYQRAAAAVEAGLSRAEGNCDLLYNGGEVYAMLGNRDKAKSMYQKALEVCEPGEFAAQIQTTLSNMKS